uniref:G-protein coupled receptors family 1 profile domain-containing protein n=1 Tax=Ascaris lumbricoides TaxID=6252 RepID=A0A9J2PT24_ASCLU
MMTTTSSYAFTTYVSRTEIDSRLIEQELDDEEYARKVLRMAFSIAYFVLFLFGTVGNGIVIVMILNVMTAMRRTRCRANSTRVNPSSTKHVFIYVLVVFCFVFYYHILSGLSIVDLLVIIHLPFLIADLLYGQWLFGEIMCKLYWFGECVNKLLSSFIMTVLSWDRYLAVCSPVKSFRIRSNAIACFVLFLCSILATLLLLPVMLNATVVHLNILTGQPVIVHIGDNKRKFLDYSMSLRIRIPLMFVIFAADEGTTVTKCMFDGMNSFFMFYTFGCGFLLPALLITYFYSRVIFRLQKSVANIRRNSTVKQSGSNSRVQQVTKRIVAVILFYFFCWTPQWTLNLLSHFGLTTVSWSTLTLSSIFFAAHLLICFNSAANPVLYALINRELRQQHMQAMLKRRRSLSNATNIALDFIGKHSHNSLHNPFCNDGNFLSTNHSLFAGFTAPLRHRSRSFDNLNNRCTINQKRGSTMVTNLLLSKQLRSTSCCDGAQSCKEHHCLIADSCTYSSDSHSFQNDLHIEPSSNGNAGESVDEKRPNLTNDEFDDSLIPIKFEATDALL